MLTGRAYNATGDCSSNFAELLYTPLPLSELGLVAVTDKPADVH